MLIRFDRGSTLARPTRTTDGAQIFEGIAGREHAHGDGLEYATGPEYRDGSEVRAIAEQLSRGVPFTVDHPVTMPASADRNVRIAGAVISARVDGPNAVAVVRVDDHFAQSLIAQGHRELSLGYSTDLDANKFQRNIRVDHLALVAAARCGATCALRADAAKGSTMCDCKKTNDATDLEGAAKARMTQRHADASASRIKNPSNTGSTFHEEVRAATGAYDTPSDVIAALALAARRANALVPDEATREAMIKAHVINGLKKLLEASK